MPSKKEALFISGPAGRQELLISSPAESRKISCIICHPHPVHGGTMHNKVVYMLAATVEALNVKTVRFNFRGVQKSEGEFDHGVGECDDLLNVVKWVSASYPDDDIWLAGFSFGAYIAIKASQLCKAQRLVAVAPPVGQLYFQHLPQITCPWILVQGGQDEVIDSTRVMAWAEAQVPPPKSIFIPDAGHFFHGQLVMLKDLLLQELAM
jgi:alpha/beta superfamily hydrolase